MKIIIANDSETMGYTCYENEEQQHIPSNMRRINVVFWAGEKTIHVYYKNREALINELNMFVGSPLSKHSEIHKAKEFMGLGFLEYIRELASEAST